MKTDSRCTLKVQIMNVPSDLFKNQQGGGYGAPTQKRIGDFEVLLTSPLVHFSSNPRVHLH